MKLIEIDVSDLPAPEPLEKVLELLEKIEKESTVVKMIHRHHPCMLFDVLKERGFISNVVQEDEQIIIYIWHESNKEYP